MNVDVETYALSPEAMFYTLGLERILKGAAIMASDRDEVVRIGKTFRREAKELIALEDPRRFLPQAPSLQDIQAAIETTIDVSGWRHTNAEGLAEVVSRSLDYLRKLVPPFMSEGLIPEEFWPSALDHGQLCRGYALLCRPWTVWDLLRCGALLPDEVACLQDVLPETLEAVSSSVLEAVIDARTARKTWLPTTLTSIAAQTLQVVEQSQDPRVADMFGEALKEQAQPRRPEPGKPHDSTATPAQKREVQQGASNA